MKTDVNAQPDLRQMDVAMRFDPQLAASSMRQPVNLGAISGAAAKEFREQKVAIIVGGESKQGE